MKDSWYYKRRNNKGEVVVLEPVDPKTIHWFEGHYLQVLPGGIPWVSIPEEDLVKPAKGGRLQLG